jgi:hypothetical protein
VAVWREIWWQIKVLIRNRAPGTCFALKGLQPSNGGRLRLLKTTGAVLRPGSQDNGVLWRKTSVEATPFLFWVFAGLT